MDGMHYSAVLRSFRAQGMLTNAKSAYILARHNDAVQSFNSVS